jgi:hypothetical protein
MMRASSGSENMTRRAGLLVAILTTLCPWPSVSQDAPPTGNTAVHAQLDPSNLDVLVINNTMQTRARLKLSTEVLTLDGRSLLRRSDSVRAVANDAVRVGDLNIAGLLRQHDTLLVALRLYENGRLISSNTLWQTAADASAKQLPEVARTTIHANTWQVEGIDNNHVRVLLENKSRTPALGINLTLIDRKGADLGPVHYSDNGLSLLPGEVRRIDIVYPAKAGIRPTLDVAGWNVRAGKVRIVSVSRDYAQGQGYYDYTRVYTPPPNANSATVTLPRK